MKILSASCFSAGVPGMPVKVIPAGRSCSPCGGRRLDRLWCQKISGSLPHDMINLITLHINLNWFPIVTVTAPCTVPRHVRDLSQTSWGGGHYLDVETRLGGIYQGSMFCLDCWGTANHLKRRVLTFRSFEPLFFPSTVWLTAMESHLTLTACIQVSCCSGYHLMWVLNP